MRGFASIAVWFSALSASAWGAEQTFPYTASVSVDEVEVRSGPGWDYYPTLHLRRGEKVQVYRHVAGGWLAIRPPAGSFSWMTARQLTQTSDKNVGEVAVDGAVAWVGSTSPNIGQHKWQVRLKRGELVEILGDRALSVGPGFATETYYQIAPPAGEFRWIHAENATALHHVADSSETSEPVQLADYQRARAKPLASATPSPSVDGEGFSERVDQLHVELSLLVTQKMEQWNLNSLRKRADALAVEAADAASARSVRAISQRISEFERLQTRYRDLVSGPARAPAKTGDPPLSVQNPVDVESHGIDLGPISKLAEQVWQQHAAEAVGSGVKADEDPNQDSPFDAQGWLMPVHSTKRIAPPFALLDDDGRVKCYVTPAPGLNLRRYVRKNVGLLGDVRHVDALRASHITAQRVVKQKTVR